MKAVVYRGKGDLRVEDVEVPAPGPGEMLVRVDACGICPTDLKKIEKGLLAGPRIFGHEIAGTVTALRRHPRARNYTLRLKSATGEPVLTLLSARFEGYDQRILEHFCTDIVSIGPYVLSGGEIPAMAVVDAVARRLPGALSEGSGELESFSAALDGGLEYPQYTRPADFRGWHVPEILLSGDHGRIDEWRRERVRSLR